VASSLRNALEAVEEAKEAATDVAAFDGSLDEGEAVEAVDVVEVVDVVDVVSADASRAARDER
jgi:hypothetical protein